MNSADAAQVVHKEMGITHADFLRLLPRALRHEHYHLDGHTITVTEPGRRIHIQLSPQGERVIASIRLPVTQVTLTFEGFSPGQQSAFLQQFDNSYRRGGG